MKCMENTLAQKKQNIPPYCAKQKSPRGRRPTIGPNQGPCIWRTRPKLGLDEKTQLASSLDSLISGLAQAWLV